MIQQTICFYVFLLMLGRTLGERLSICAMVPDGNYVRSSRGCNYFNRCVNGSPIHGECPTGYAFNSRNQMCESNLDVDCHSCSPFGIQHIPNPDSCILYYRCVNGIRTSMLCSPGLMFDRNFGDCNLEVKVQCDTKSGMSAICEPYRHLNFITVGNPLDCTSYYRCLNGIAYEAACPSSLYYNPNTAECEPLGNYCLGAQPVNRLPEDI